MHSQNFITTGKEHWNYGQTGCQRFTGALTPQAFKNFSALHDVMRVLITKDHKTITQKMISMISAKSV